MSLLLDALRRAAASKQGPASDQYTVPRRPDMPDEREASPTADEPGEDGELTLEPEMLQAPETAREAETSATAETPGRAAMEAPPVSGSRTAADTLAGPRRRRRRRGSAVRLVLGGIAVLGALAAIGIGGWWYYLQSQQASRTDLAAWEPTAEPLVGEEPLAVGSGPVGDGTALAAAGGDEGDVAEPARGTAAGEGAGVARADTAVLEGGGAGDAAEAEANGQKRADGDAGGEAAGGGSGTDGAGQARSDAESGDRTTSASASESGSNTAATASPKQASSSAQAERRAEPMVQASRAPSELARTLQAGYAALRAGDVNAAGHAYARALEIAPRNRDALLGAASVAQQRGDPERAATYYRRVLQDHPRDDYARAALAGLEAARQPRRSESELKELLRERPGSASLHFALGNVYAAESRWSEAQRAWFEAHRADPGNADYAYNLAVALDHLGQRDAARTYYRKALEAGGESAAGFPVAAVRRRLEQLQ